MDAVSLIHRRHTGVGMGLVIAAASFNLALAFVNAHGLTINKSVVIAGEAAICAIAMLWVHRTISLRIAVFSAVFLIYICFLWSITDAIDFQLIANVFIIPLAFFLCGSALAEPSDADKLVYLLIGLVFAVAVWEWFWTNQYLSTFEISKYYIDKGRIASVQLWNHRGGAVNAFRNTLEGGRVLFPMLGPYRSSSIFLEPTSIGYFSVISFAWLLVRFRAAPLRNLAFMALVFMLVVMGDSRTAAITCAILMIARVLPPLPRVALWLLPFVAIVAIVGVALAHPTYEVDQTVTGRLVGSGRLMLGFSAREWLGLGNSLKRIAIDNLDSGYAYLIYTIGISGMILLWSAFSLSGDATVVGARYRTMLAIYLSLSLCVTEGVFSIKTAALAWFLLGAAGARGEDRGGSPADGPAPAIARRPPGLPTSGGAG